ncbi:hypothetical protein LEP1GSC058_1912 [Leptospira fainei serovar Hurstbridge str. BUT 6]|uniref:Uncharacterized protein n=2 Tax=Leptospira fainei TaxID=48782 RepID=S3VFZ4_9LEPT|nr:hypothetical protein LEP1GSC058_1912 [Leptospira fainei serovar Hurstbridge str. BUT 6]
MYRLTKPQNAAAEKQYGLVAYGLYLVNPGSKSSIAKFFDTNDQVYSVPNGPVFVVKRVDDPTLRVTIDPFVTKSPVKIGTEDKIDLYETVVLKVREFTTRMFEDTRPEYIIGSVSYTYCYMATRFVNGIAQSYRQCDTLTYPVDPYTAYKAMPIIAKPGDIKFLGIFQARLVESNQADPYARNFSGGLASAIGLGTYYRVNLSADDDYIIKSQKKEFIDAFYGNEEKTLKGAEINFLKALSTSEKSGYWKDAAEKTLIKLMGKR